MRTKKSNENTVRRYFSFLTDLHNSTVGVGWVNCNYIKISKRHNVSNSALHYATKYGLIEKQPGRSGRYRWIGEVNVTQELTMSLLRFINNTLNHNKTEKKKILKSENFDNKLEKYTSNQLINELKKRGFTGTISQNFKL